MAEPEGTVEIGFHDTERAEAFSDGVMAVAITLLVLGLAVPVRDTLGASSLAHALLHAWPSYVAYVTSFLVIGIIWINHHTMFSLIRRVDRQLLVANLFFLMIIVIIPFATALVAEYLTSPVKADAHLALAIYSATSLAMSIGFVALWLSATRPTGFLVAGLDPATLRRGLRRFGVGIFIYTATIVLAFVSAPLCLAVHFLTALYYCFDQLGSAAKS